MLALETTLSQATALLKTELFSCFQIEQMAERENIGGEVDALKMKLTTAAGGTY